MKLIVPVSLPSALGGPGCGAGEFNSSSDAFSIAVFSREQLSSHASIMALGLGASGESTHFAPRAYSGIHGSVHLSPRRASTIARAQVTWPTIHRMLLQSSFGRL